MCPERQERKHLSNLIMHDDVLTQRSRLDEAHWYVGFLARRCDSQLAQDQLLYYAPFSSVVWC